MAKYPVTEAGKIAGDELSVGYEAQLINWLEVNTGNHVPAQSARANNA